MAPFVISLGQKGPINKYVELKFYIYIKKNGDHSLSSFIPAYVRG